MISWFSFRSRRRPAVLSLAVGDRDYFRYTLPTQRAYAKRIGAEFILLDKRRFPDSPLYFEKCQIRNALRKYRRILYLDADIMVQPHAPSIFELPVPPDHFGAVIDKSEKDILEHPDALGFKDWGSHDFSIFEEHFGVIGEPRSTWYYINAGVMLVSRAHVRLFNELSLLGPFVRQNPGHIKGCDQGALNYLLNRDGYPGFPLDKRWNRIFGHHDLSPTVAESYFIHYAGTDHKVEKIRDDFPAAEQREA